jgi:2-iminobutanoate/2-iminopropanoate deaminase
MPSSIGFSVPCRKSGVLPAAAALAAPALAVAAATEPAHDSHALNGKDERHGDQAREDSAAGIHVVIRAGQPAYTHSVSGTGKMIFVAGQLARDANGNLVDKGDMRAQIQQVGDNIKTCLEAAGATPADIVKTNTFVTSYEEFAKHVRLRYFGPATPTSTTVEIRRLADPDAMIEIEAIAVVE